MIKKIILKIHSIITNDYTIFLMKAYGVNLGREFRSNGLPLLNISRKGRMIIGNNFKMNNGKRYNIIGRQGPCCFVTRDTAEIIIGNNVGISSTAIIAHKKITIGDNVKIGGNCVIYDTDFHSLDPLLRKEIKHDQNNTKCKEVYIGDNVFIGGHSTILKGVTIGNNSIVGAGSVVTKSIPENEIWAGNPAKFIKII